MTDMAHQLMGKISHLQCVTDMTHQQTAITLKRAQTASSDHAQAAKDGRMVGWLDGFCREAPG